MKTTLAFVALALVGVSIVVAAHRPGSPAAYVAVYLAFTIIWCLFIRSETE